MATSFTGFGSYSVPLRFCTVAVFAFVPEESFVATMVTVALAPFAIRPSEQVTSATPEQDPWLGVAETRVMPAGIGSLRRTSSALAGPLFVTVTV